MDSVTSLSLLAALQDPHDGVAWHRFVRQHQPLIVSYALNLGLSEADAHDAAQETMAAFAQGYAEGKYDRCKGRLRNWLYGIAKRKIVDVYRREGRDKAVSELSDGSKILRSLEDPDSLGATALWEKLWEEAILRECLTVVRQEVEDQTYRAFHRYVIDEVPAIEVARELGVARNVVFLAKHRVMKRLGDIKSRLEEVA